MVLALLLSSGLGLGAVVAARSGAQSVSATVRLYSWDQKTELPLINQIFDTMHKTYPGIKVKIEAGVNISPVKMLAQIAAGTAPDVIQVGDIDVPWYVANRAFTPLDPYLRRDEVTKDLWFPAAYSLGVVDGKLFALTKDYATLAIFYNKDLFARAHLPYPQAGWTWNDLLADARKLTVVQGGRPVQWGIKLPDAWARGVEPLVRDYGGQLASGDGSKIMGYMNSPQTIAATQFYADMYTRYKVAPTLSQQAALSNLDLFASGKVAMEWTGPWSITTWQQTKGLHFGVALMPAHNGNAYTNIAWAGFAMNARTRNPEAAWQVIKALSGIDGSAVFAKWGLPAIKVVASRLQSIDPTSYPYRAQFLALIANVPGTPADMRSADGHAAVETPYENAIRYLMGHSGASVKAALAGAAASGTQELSTFKSKR
jgi:multiple sugar transport system substrate-binding protein